MVPYDLHVRGMFPYDIRLQAEFPYGIPVQTMFPMKVRNSEDNHIADIFIKSFVNEFKVTKDISIVL
jgi:hypothetical protein